MLLASSLEPTGPKSKSHYLILRHDNRRELVKLPGSYSDLKKLVEKLFHVDPERFHVESKELNVCVGERIRISEELWDDIAELLGNVYIVPFSDDALDSHPEAAPEPDLPSQSKSTPVYTADQGIIDLPSPLINDELVALNIGYIDFDANVSSTTKFQLQFCDANKDVGITVGIIPHEASAYMASSTHNSNFTCPMKAAFSSGTEHFVVIHKQQTRFLLHLDAHLVGTIEAPTHLPLVSVTYNLGLGPPFKGPISAQIYSGPLSFRDESRPYRPIFTSLDKRDLYRRILISDPHSAAHIPWELAAYRSNIALTRQLPSSSEWRCPGLPFKQWTSLQSGLHPRSILVLHYSFTKVASGRLDINFRRQKQHSADTFQIYMYTPGAGLDVDFYEDQSKGGRKKIHNIKLGHSMHAIGEHSVTIINNDGKVHVLFDFKQSTVLPTTAFIDQGLGEIFHDIPSSVEINMYDFRFS